MPSPDAGSIDLPIQVFGGRVSQFDSQALPAGASPFNQDVIFSGGNAGGEISVGGYGSRPGTVSLYAPFGGNPTVNYIRTFVDSQGQFHQMLLDGLGVLRDDFPEGTFTTVSSTLVAGSFAQSETYAGKEWLAIGDGKFGIDIPRQYDGTNSDRVSQVGPGAAPFAADENVSYTLLASPNGLLQPTLINITSVTQAVNGTVTVVLASNLSPGTVVGDAVLIAGVTVAGYNNGGVAVVITAILSATSFQYILTVTGLANSGGGTMNSGLVGAVISTQLALPSPQSMIVAGAGVASYNGTWNLRIFPVGGTTATLYIGNFGAANSGGGTLSNGGNISQGLHQLSVSYIMRSGFITCPAPPGSWNAAGSHRVAVAQIPTGHAAVVGRIVMFTPVIPAPAKTGPFFYFSGAVSTASSVFPSMVIGDNITTAATFDFLDSVLQTATAASNLFNLLELGECSAVATYSERMFYMGERNKVNSAGGGGGFNNLSFDGGFPYNGSQFQTPLGWTNDSTAGGRAGPAGFANAVWGDALSIFGDGATAIPARIFQSAFQDYLGVPIINPATAYSVRVRLKQAGGGTGTFHIRLNSLSQGPAGVGLQVAATAIQVGTYTEFTAQLVTATQYPSPSAVPSDLRLEVYMDGTPSALTVVTADNIEPYPTRFPINRTIVRASYALQPEAFDGTTGFMVVGKDNGQAARCAFKLLDKKIYVVKERSFYVSQDDGANEPSLWYVDRISESVGTPSVNGVATAGEAWAVVASHDGAYIFWGAQPVKISQEEQPDWDTINWNAGQSIWTVVDQQNKRIHIGTPTGSSAVPNAEFVLDYSQLADAEDIAANPQAHYAYFNPTNVVAPGRARKWTIWNLSNNSAAMTYRADGSYHLLRGNAAGNGKIYDQVNTQTTDDGATINAIYQTYYFPDRMEEIQLQLGAHGKTFKFLTGYIAGAGKVTWSTHGQQDNRVLPLTTLTLRNPDKWNFEMNVNFETERASLIMATSGNGTWFHLSYLAPTIQRSIARSVRGVR